MALKSLEGQDIGKISLVHHSDRGVQYTSSKYISLLKANNLRISVTENVNPKENSQIVSKKDVTDLVKKEFTVRNFSLLSLRI